MLRGLKTRLTSQERGDATKKGLRKKKYVMVEILGNLPHVSVYAANLSETKNCQTL